MDKVCFLQKVEEIKEDIELVERIGCYVQFFVKRRLKGFRGIYESEENGGREEESETFLLSWCVLF